MGLRKADVGEANEADADLLGTPADAWFGKLTKVSMLRNTDLDDKAKASGKKELHERVRRDTKT